jgi:hypothetical protein
MSSLGSSGNNGGGKVVVIKVGSSTAIDVETGSVSLRRLSAIVSTVSTLRAKGYGVVVVTSGAVGLGCRRLGVARPKKTEMAVRGKNGDTSKKKKGILRITIRTRIFFFLNRGIEGWGAKKKENENICLNPIPFLISDDYLLNILPFLLLGQASACRNRPAPPDECLD